MHDVFLSYSSKDKSAADAVCHALEAEGIRCWIAPRDVIAGKDWNQAILDAIMQAKLLVLILSHHSSSSRQVQSEVLTAVQDNRIVIPLRIEDISPEGALKLQLTGTHWLDAFPPPLDRHLQKLAASVHALLGDAPLRVQGTSAAAPRRQRWLWWSVAAGAVLVGLAIATRFLPALSGSREPAPSVTGSVASANSAPSTGTDCDRLAASAYDKTRPPGLPGVGADQIDAALAVPACERALAQDPSPRVQFQLARSQGRAGHLDEAVRLYKLAAASGFVPAQAFLAEYYEQGNGVPQSFSEAARLNKLAADQGFASAQVALGVLYENGRGVAQSFSEAARLYQLAANQGDPYAQYNLAEYYEMGRGVTQSYAEAARLYQLAAAQGLAPAQYSLGALYLSGHGVAQSFADAVRLYQLAANQGYADAQIDLGALYEKGQGVNQSYSEAARLYELAAAQDNAMAQNNLGALYAGGMGVAQDYREATRLFKLAADQGVALAQNNLGWAYEHGLGVAPSKPLAIASYQAAARQGEAHAQESLKRLNQSW